VGVSALDGAEVPVGAFDVEGCVFVELGVLAGGCFRGMFALKRGQREKVLWSLTVSKRIHEGAAVCDADLMFSEVRMWRERCWSNR